MDTKKTQTAAKKKRGQGKKNIKLLKEHLEKNDIKPINIRN